MGFTGGQPTRSSPLKATCAGSTTTEASCSVMSLRMILSYGMLNCHWSLPKVTPVTRNMAERSLCVRDCSTMVFVNVARADGEIASKRKLGSGFTMTSWSLGTPLSSTRISWVKDGAMEADEIWTQYRNLSLLFPFFRQSSHL